MSPPTVCPSATLLFPDRHDFLIDACVHFSVYVCGM